MSAAGAHLKLQPERCNQCAACVAACESGAVRVAQGYVHIDWHACNHCCACVDVCEPQAIQREVVALRSTAAVPAAAVGGDVSKVVVGSRAEAKAVRKAAEQAAKQAAKGMRAAGDRTRSPFAAPAAADGAATAGSASRSRAAAAPRGKSVPTARPTAGVAWGLADAAVVLAVLLLTIVAKNAVLAIPALKLMPIAGLAAVRVAVLVVYYGIQLGALTFLAGRHGSTLAESFGLSRKEGEAGGETGLANAGLVLGLLVGVEVAALSYGMAVQALGWRQPISLSSDISTVFGGGGVGLFLSALLVAVVAPVAEELAFRGVIMRSLGERWGMWPAIAVSAILFAIYHANLWLLFPMLVFGVALGWLAWTRRSLWPAIALHVAYNSLAVAAAFLVR